MAEYVDKNALKVQICYWLKGEKERWENMIDAQPIVKIVRCKQCRFFTGMHCTLMNHEVGPEWFCSEGWKKDDTAASDPRK